MNDALTLALAKQPPLDCGTCGHSILPALGKLDQTGIPLDAVVYACRAGGCEWKRTVRLVVDASNTSVAVGAEVSL